MLPHYCHKISAKSVLSFLYNVISATSCASLYDKHGRTAGGAGGGIRVIDPDGFGTFEVMCDVKNGGGWTVIQRRVNANVDFYRGWCDYKIGFGSLGGNFWLGLDRIHRLAKARKHVLRVDLEDFKGNKAYVLYKKFFVASENDGYALNASDWSGKQ